MGPNAVEAMKGISEELYKCFTRFADTDRDFQGHWLAYRWGKEKTPFSNGKSFGEIIEHVKTPSVLPEKGRQSTYRADFLEALVKLIKPGTIEYGKKVEMVTDTVVDGDECVEVRFEDGKVIHAEAVLACDGIWSTIRQQVVGPESARAHYINEYCYRGLVPMSVAESILGPEYAHNGNIFCGHNRYVTTYPVQNHQLLNTVFICHDPGDRERDQYWTKEEMHSDFWDWAEPMRKLLAAIPNPDRKAIFDHAQTPRYHRGRVCLFGDAAHASAPHQGAGGGMALEGVEIFLQLLAHFPDQIVKCFEKYETLHRPRAQLQVQTSRQAGRAFQLRSSQNLKVLGDDLKVRHHWIWTKQPVTENFGHSVATPENDRPDVQNRQTSRELVVY